MFTDRTISCVDCAAEFTFTAGEQDFYAQRGFTEAPKRCTSCRAARKAARSGSSLDMSGGNAGAGGYSAGYGTNASEFVGQYRERRPRELFEATCADCGRTANVPFRPSGIKPVYCSDCFQSRR